MTKRAVTRTCFAGILPLVEFGCGGGTPILRSAPTLSISTTFLQGGMVKFPYGQTAEIVDI